MSDESYEVKCLAPEDIKDLPMVGSVRVRLSDYATKQGEGW